jgi:hypothetical protein
MKRKEAYAALAKGLNIASQNCHVGMFDVPTCHAALLVIESIRSASTKANP